MPNSIVKTLTVNGTTYDLKDVDSELYAPKASPALTGTPTAPTATSGTDTTQIATTAFVQDAVSSKANTSDVLIKTNTTSYTPTGDYNPATKKYVDDATASITDEKLSTGTIGNNVYYPIVGTNTASATTKYIDSTGFKYDATSSTNGYARLYLGNGTASGTEGSKYGRLMIYGTTAYAVTLDSGSPTENRDISLPNKNGTIALTSDIPTKVSDLTNDSGFITSYTETDPIFVASAAHGITSSDISNWNSKTSNTGTVTQVTAGTGLSIGSTAGGNFTTSGTINHTNSVTAQNTQAIYPIKIDAQGHISAYGDAVTPLTASSTLDATKLSGTVPTASLPSYVDDVLEYSAKSGFPATGETGKIYVDTSTNLTYRWGGSAYVEISPSLALGTTSSTAFRGDYGEAAYTHAVTNKGSAFSSGLYKITTNSEGHVTAATAVAKSDITGLGIPAQDTTYTFDGTYNASTNKAATVSTVTNAINALDGGTIGSPGSGKTITALSQTNGNVSATFGDISITKSQVSDFPTLGTAASRDVASTYDPTDTDEVLTGAAIASAINTVAPLVITITGTTSDDVTTYSANRTYAQVGTAYANNRQSYVLYDNAIYNLDSYKSNLSRYYFTRTYEDDTGVYLDQFTISASNLVSHSSTQLVREDDMTKYAKTINIAYDNCNIDGSYGTTAKITYTEGTLFWYGEHQLGRATTTITHGDTLTLNTNYVATTIADEFKRLPDIINSLIATALAEYDDGDVLSYGNVEEES